MKYLQTKKSKILISLVLALTAAFIVTPIYINHRAQLCPWCPIDFYRDLAVLFTAFFIGFLVLLSIIGFISSYGWKTALRLNKFKITVFLVLFILSITPVLNFFYLTGSGPPHIGLPLPFLTMIDPGRSWPIFPFYLLDFLIDWGEFSVKFSPLKLLVDIIILYTATVLFALKLKRYKTAFII